MNVHYLDLMGTATLRFEDAAAGRPYHAAYVQIPARAGGTDPHSHADYAEVMYVVAGHGVHRLGRGAQDLVPGDLVLVRPTDEHAFAALPPQDLQFFNVAFTTSLWRDFLDVAGVGPVGRWDHHALPPRRRLVGRDAASADRAFRALLGCFHDRPATLDVVGFLAEVLALFDRDEPRPGGADSRPEWLRRACAAMRREENLREGLPRLLELAAVSHGYLARSMRRHYGLTPVEFVTDLRLRWAATQLTSTPLSVTEIALRSGFASQSYFTRRFTAAHGLAPRLFRDRARRAIVP